MLISNFDIAVSTSTLLKQADFILFLNKCDLLKRKLEAGLRITDYISRFQGDDQTVDGVIQCKAVLLRAVGHCMIAKRGTDVSQSQSSKLYSLKHGNVRRPDWVYNL